MSTASERALKTAQALRERFVNGEQLTDAEVDLVVLANVLTIERANAGSHTAKIFEVPTKDIRAVVALTSGVLMDSEDQKMCKRVLGWVAKIDASLHHTRER